MYIEDVTLSNRQSLYGLISDLIKHNPDMSVNEIASRLNADLKEVKRILTEIIISQK